MKKFIVMAVAALCISSTALAQRQRMSQEEIQARRTEMVEKQAEKLAKDFNLKDDAKTTFIATYKQYQDELDAIQRAQREENKSKDQNQDKEKSDKKLTDEEATARIQKAFADQEAQITASQQRLAVNKKYYAEFSKTLTPQQLVQIFASRRNSQRNGQGGFGGQRGGQGGFQGGNRGGFGGGDFGGAPQGGFGGGDF